VEEVCEPFLMRAGTNRRIRPNLVKYRHSRWLPLLGYPCGCQGSTRVSQINILRDECRPALAPSAAKVLS
jgi:hypothetical protein